MVCKFGYFADFHNLLIIADKNYLNFEDLLDLY